MTRSAPMSFQSPPRLVSGTGGNNKLSAKPTPANAVLVPTHPYVTVLAPRASAPIHKDPSCFSALFAPPHHSSPQAHTDLLSATNDSGVISIELSGRQIACRIAKRVADGFPDSGDRGH